MKSMKELFEKYYKEVMLELDEVINNYNNDLIKNKTGYLKKNLEFFTNLNSNGKMIRGFLINLGYKILSSKNSNYSMPLALAYEIFQTSILIHDDIIDNDNFRRGKETIAYANYKRYSDYSEVEAKKVSDSIAICIGDYGFYEANQIIVKNYKNDCNVVDVLSYFNDIVLKTIDGEILDVILPFECKNNIFNSGNLEDIILNVYRLKTAYYTIIGPLCLGMILSGSSKDKIDDITKFGEKIGIAYQIQDDILGIYNDNMGKVLGSDIKEFKQTILYSYVSEKSNEYMFDLLKYYGKDDINKEDVESVKKIFNDSGAYNYACRYMNDLYDEGLNLLDSFSWINKEDKDILKGFVMYLKERNK